MVNAIVLINAKRNMIPETVQALVDLPGIAEVYSVAGLYDIVAIVRVKKNEDLAEVVTKNMLKLEGIEDTTTLFAFEAFSRYELDRMFSIGLDE